MTAEQEETVKLFLKHSDKLEELLKAKNEVAKNLNILRGLKSKNSQVVMVYFSGTYEGFNNFKFDHVNSKELDIVLYCAFESVLVATLSRLEKEVKELYQTLRDNGAHLPAVKE